MTAVIFELVLASKLVGAESAGEGVGRVLGVDVTLESRVLVEACAALALVGLVGGLPCVVVEGVDVVKRRKADGAGIYSMRPVQPAPKLAGVKKKILTHWISHPSRVRDPIERAAVPRCHLLPAQIRDEQRCCMFPTGPL